MSAASGVLRKGIPPENEALEPLLFPYLKPFVLPKVNTNGAEPLRADQ